MPPQHPFSAVVTLPRDDEAEEVHEPTANGALHWAPHLDRGYSRRMQRIAAWVADAQPEAVVVDVSVEVAVLVRLLGVPTVVVALPGERTDAAHRFVHQLADHILAAWPAELNTPSWLKPHGSKVSYVGGISRFEHRTPKAPSGGARPLVLGGAAGPFGTDWGDLTVLGGSSGVWTDDPWPYLCDADLVISHAGQNSIADIAAARRPAVILPQPRPFDEQLATATVLDRHGLAAVSARWPSVEGWPALLQRARSIDPNRWRRWRVDGAAARAAAAIESTAARCRNRLVRSA
ncbi:hypothetical protein H7J88_21335 [Mycolicibacterium flavescens]|nr:hypothetical protein [Mycolicibacterium flavescens]